MKTTEVWQNPRRISDLITLKEAGCNVTCKPTFEVLPVDFLHSKSPFKAFIFLCRFYGEVDGKPYSFRKCYARGCPKNECVHVSQAVMIANRYLQRDYHKLSLAGIEVPDKLFTLEGMIVKFDQFSHEHTTDLTLEEYIEKTAADGKVSMSVRLEHVPAVEHFADQKNSQTFLMADFTVTADVVKQSFQRCLSCFPTDSADEVKVQQEGVANARLKSLYQHLAGSAVEYNQAYFQ
jgi:hypothetical protein